MKSDNTATVVVIVIFMLLAIPCLLGATFAVWAFMYLEGP
jgi:nitrate reductase NapE component